MKILITGGGGYIGTALATHLTSRGYSVEVVDTFWFGDFLADIKIVKHQCDIRDGIPTPHFGIPDAVIHLASIANDPSADFGGCGLAAGRPNRGGKNRLPANHPIRGKDGRGVRSSH